MQNQLIIRILGILLMIFSITMVPPMAVAFFFGDGGGGAFFSGFVISLFTGLFLFLPRKNIRGELRTRDGFLVVVLFWAVLSLFGAIPLYLSAIEGFTVADAVFESFSGLTTTGATVIVGLDDLPHAVLFYRQQLQWLGGMGIIVLAVAILPMLGIGGMQLYRAETPRSGKRFKIDTSHSRNSKSTLVYLFRTNHCLCTRLLGRWHECF